MVTASAPEQASPLFESDLVRIEVVRHNFKHYSSYVDSIHTTSSGYVGGGGTKTRTWFNQGYLIKVANISQLVVRAEFEYETYKDAERRTLDKRNTVATEFLKPGQAFDVPIEIYDSEKVGKFRTIRVTDVSLVTSGYFPIESKGVEWALYDLTQAPALLPKKVKWLLMGSTLALVIAGVGVTAIFYEPTLPSDACGRGFNITKCGTVDSVYDVIHRDMMEIGSMRTSWNGGVPGWLADIDEANTLANGKRWTDWKAAVLDARRRMTEATPDTAQKRAIILTLKQAFARLYDKYGTEEDKNKRFEALGRDRSLFDQTLRPGGPIEFNALKVNF